ncbi:glycoside hydrolase superfamily [Aspergillus californicus]
MFFLAALRLLSTTVSIPLAMTLEFPGDTVVLQSWRLQSSRGIEDAKKWSLPDADVSTWYHIGAKATVIAGLIENNVYNESDLFFSDHLSKLDESQFKIPWLYQAQLHLPPLGEDEHLILNVHGISSKADIFFNGKEIGFSAFQRGSYAGRAYELTRDALVGKNALLIQAHPTNYLEDLAVGWIDWSPHPPDSGMGVWRTVDIKLNGPVSLSPPRVITTFQSDNFESPLSVRITVNVDVTNRENHPAEVTIRCTIIPPDGGPSTELMRRVRMIPHEKSTVGLDTTLIDPKIWWPAEWGSQPLYQVKLNVSLLSGALSDTVPATNFGIRKVSSSLNMYNDTQFTINGHPFQVRGAGYSPDIFLRFDTRRVQRIFSYAHQMGFNTIRLEGKQEHPELYDIADRMGLMIMAGWECCDKWEAWNYSDNTNGVKWRDEDYHTAHMSMLHEAAMMQPHPSLLAFLIGSDYWPNDRATNIYLDALHAMDWPNPIIASASMRGHPKQLEPSGMKMDGPYDWVPPNYWYGNEFGAAFGFGSEQGAGVGTPELSSLERFLSLSDLQALWASPDAGQYHLSPSGSVFHDRKIYNRALVQRYGSPSGLEDYVSKAQMMDYEATRAEFEAFAARQNAPRPATGVIYWMLNSPWPSLHWQLFDYYLRPSGAYFGAKTGGRLEHVSYDYESRAVFIINHSRQSQGARRVAVDLVDVHGATLLHREMTIETAPFTSKQITDIPEIAELQGVGFLRLVLSDDFGTVLSRNVYWLSKQNDELIWGASTWYTTPVRTYADFTALSHIQAAEVEPTAFFSGRAPPDHIKIQFALENKSDVPAFFIRLVLLDPETGEEITPVFWADNYVTLLPREWLQIDAVVEDSRDCRWTLRISGRNVEQQERKCAMGDWVVVP